MRTADGKRFRDLLRAMSRALSANGAELDGPVLDVYWIALSDWTLAEFEQACGHLMKTAKFMPRPAEFTELRKAARLSAGEAWALVLEAVRGYAELPADPAVQAAVRALGGVKAIGMLDSDQMPFVERRFAEHYESISDREEVREALPALTGGPRLESLYNTPRRLA